MIAIRMSPPLSQPGIAIVGEVARAFTATNRLDRWFHPGEAGLVSSLLEPLVILSAEVGEPALFERTG
jgi:hypothetical protein